MLKFDVCVIGRVLLVRLSGTDWRTGKTERLDQWIELIPEHVPATDALGWFGHGIRSGQIRVRHVGRDAQ